jgi:hypothetical protein
MDGKSVVMSNPNERNKLQYRSTPLDNGDPTLSTAVAATSFTGNAVDRVLAVNGSAIVAVVVESLHCCTEFRSVTFTRSDVDIADDKNNENDEGTKNNALLRAAIPWMLPVSRPFLCFHL